MNKISGLLFLLIISLLTGCSTTSTVILKNNSPKKIEISGSDSTTLYGLDESRTRNIQIPGDEVLYIYHPGGTHSLLGGIATGIGAVSAAWGGIAFAVDEDFEWPAIIGGVLLATGIPVLVWGMTAAGDAYDKSLNMWEGRYRNRQHSDSIIPSPVILSDGEENHYGIGFSGRF